MKKRCIAALLLTGMTALCLAGCGGSADDKVIKVGATPTPHAEVLEVIADNLEDAGYTLEIVEYNDYIIPNTATESGELDANYFQHQPYLDDFNANNGTQVVSVSAPHVEPMALYGGKQTSLDALTVG